MEKDIQERGQPLKIGYDIYLEYLFMLSKAIFCKWAKNSMDIFYPSLECCELVNDDGLSDKKLLLNSKIGVYPLYEIRNCHCQCW